jgi:hypothetical protein
MLLISRKSKLKPVSSTAAPGEWLRWETKAASVAKDIEAGTSATRVGGVRGRVGGSQRPLGTAVGQPVHPPWSLSQALLKVKENVSL